VSVQSFGWWFFNFLFFNGFSGFFSVMKNSTVPPKGRFALQAYILRTVPKREKEFKISNFCEC
jgi:hypothetical protein